MYDRSWLLTLVLVLWYYLWFIYHYLLLINRLETLPQLITYTYYYYTIIIIIIIKSRATK